MSSRCQALTAGWSSTGFGVDAARRVPRAPFGERRGAARVAVVESATIRPWSISSRRSHSSSVLRRWAIISVVRPAMSRRIAAMISRSVATSTELVGSSRTRMGASFRKARASEIRCRSPPERRMPRSPTCVA